MMNYKVFDKDMYFEIDHIIIMNLKTNEINHEEKLYFYDGKELKQLKDFYEFNLKQYETVQKTQEEFTKFSTKHAKPPIGYITIGNIIFEYMLNRNNVILIAFANISKIEDEISKEIANDTIRIIYKSKMIFNKEWNFESTLNLSPEIKDNVTKIIEKALKSAKAILKNNL
jgi:MFS superfamily sulfate permease-like transporter